MTTEQLAKDLLAIIDNEMYVNDFGGLQAGRDATTDIHAAMAKLQASLAQRQPLTDGQIADIVIEMNGNEPTGLFWRDLTRAIEAAHGIGEKT